MAGFVTEYSGVRYLIFFMAEWGNLYVIGAVVTTLFLGGWQIPPITDNVVLRAVLEFLTFFVKSYFWVLVAMWMRATLPRTRVDQLMSVCWKYLVPISFVNVLGTALWVLLFPERRRRGPLLHVRDRGRDHRVFLPPRRLPPAAGAHPPAAPAALESVVLREA